MKKLKWAALKLWRDESGQGTAEYVLILVAVVGLAIIFKEQLQEMLGEKIGKLKTSVMGFSEK